MKSVFLVDDSKFMRTFVTNILKKNGHNVAGEAENCDEALQKLVSIRPDIVILDLIMEKINAIEVLKTIKRIVPETKVIVCSVVEEKSLVLESFSEGASEYVKKPFTEYGLLKAIQNAV